MHQMRSQWIDQRAGQDRHSVLGALCVAYNDLAVFEIDVLHPQRQAFAQSQSAAVQQTGDETVLSTQAPDHRLNLVAAQHRRQPLRAPGPDDVLQPRQLDLEHFLVQEKQRRQRLVLRRCRHVSIDRKVGQERFQFRPAQVPRVAHAIPVHVPADPVDVLLLGPIAVVKGPQYVAHLPEQGGFGVHAVKHPSCQLTVCGNGGLFRPET